MTNWYEDDALSHKRENFISICIHCSSAVWFVDSFQVWLCNSQLSVFITLLESKRCSHALTKLRRSSRQNNRSEWEQQIKQRLTTIEDRVSRRASSMSSWTFRTIFIDSCWVIDHCTINNACTHEWHDSVTLSTRNSSQHHWRISWDSHEHWWSRHHERLMRKRDETFTNLDDHDLSKVIQNYQIARIVIKIQWSLRCWKCFYWLWDVLFESLYFWSISARSSVDVWET